MYRLALPKISLVGSFFLEIPGFSCRWSGSATRQGCPGSGYWDFEHQSNGTSQGRGDLLLGLRGSGANHVAAAHANDLASQDSSWSLGPIGLPPAVGEETRGYITVHCPCA